MNLTKLFDTQKLLDAAIVEKKGLAGRDMLPEKILALQVELGECANEWRGFKFWSEDREPRVILHTWIDGAGDLNESRWEPNIADGEVRAHGIRNPLLEEYVDCLHFILSIGLELGCDDMKPYLIKIKEPIDMFSAVFFEVTCISTRSDNKNYSEFHYAELLSRFFGLGKSLGFTWDQIEQAYYDKNEINHSRQNNGY